MDALSFLGRFININEYSSETPLSQAGLDDWHLIVLICEWETATATKISQMSLAYVKTLHDLIELLKESLRVTD